MDWLKRIFKRIYGSYFFASASLFFLRHCFYRLPSGLFESGENLALHHPRAIYPVHALILPKRRVYSPYNWEASEMENVLRDGLRAARMLPTADYRQVMVWINGGRFQMFSQAHAHVYPRKTPVIFKDLRSIRGEGYTIVECARYGRKEADLLRFTADEDLFERFADVFYHEILPAYQLDARGYSIYISVPLPVDPAAPITALTIRMGDPVHPA